MNKKRLDSIIKGLRGGNKALNLPGDEFWDWEASGRKSVKEELRW